MCLILAATAAEPTGLQAFLQALASYAWMIFGVGAGLTFVIFVHELGHFLVAKACGVKCEKFYIGFDFFEVPIPFTRWKIPRSLVKFQLGETEYGIGSLPLGGYVKMLGQDDDPRNAEAEAARIKAVQQTTPGDELVSAQTVEGKTILLDERSYPAKPVPARMAIISAGVIMNLIFAVILAATAYRLGVEEMPAVVGSVTAGGPAWEKNIEPGSKILQIGRGGGKHEFLRFGDLLPAAVLNGTDRELPLLVRKPDGQEVWYQLRPTTRLISTERRAMLGIAPSRSLEIGVSPKAEELRRPHATPPVQDHDKVTRVAGQPVATGEEAVAIFAQHARGPLTITVERGEGDESKRRAKSEVEKKQTIEVTLQPRPFRELGMSMKMGPITAIRDGSPAMDAGFHAGDVLLKVNGEPVGDPLTLSDRLAPNAESPKMVTIVVARKDRQDKVVERELTVTPELPRQPTLDTATTSTASIEPLGIAFSLTSEIAELTAGGPADKAGLRAGDIVTRAEFPRGPDKDVERERIRLTGMRLYEPIKLDGAAGGWVSVVKRLQVLLPENRVKLTWTRGGQTMSAELAPRESTTLFDVLRGLSFYSTMDMHVTSSNSEAVRLGFRETVEQVKQVLTILHSLITGRVSATNLSGPLGIIGTAGSFASQGLAPLLIFLTILSANLAVLNFLPIPALDGGHMLFLAAEWIRGKPVDERLQVRLTIAGVICLLSLMVFATAMDIGRFAEMIQRWFS
jgi:regulator of sigma E protease